MTRKSETLKAKKEIQNLFKLGKRLKAKYVSLVYLPNQNSKTRFLFCADRYARKAYQRNRIKRVLRALVIANDLKWGQFDLALIVNYEFTKINFEERLKIIKFLHSKLEL